MSTRVPGLRCRLCGQPVIDPSDFDPGVDDYADTPGGHADRHTLVVEAAERVLNGVES